MSRNICIKDGCTQMLRGMWDTLYCSGPADLSIQSMDLKVCEFIGDKRDIRENVQEFTWPSLICGGG